MANLYEIDEQLRILEEYMVDPETGEILSEEEFNNKFDEIQMAITDKIENTMCFYKNLMSDVEAFKAEENKIASRRKAKENLAERLKKRINDYIVFQHTTEDGTVNYEDLNSFKMETPRMKISYRKSNSVEIDDLAQIPNEFLKVKVETTADKNALKKAITNGQNISGAHLSTNYNMQVK